MMNFTALGMLTAILFSTIIDPGVVLWGERIACAIVVPIETLHYWRVYASLLFV